MARAAAVVRCPQSGAPAGWAHLEHALATDLMHAQRQCSLERRCLLGARGIAGVDGVACLQERSQHLRGHAVEVICGSRTDGAELPCGPGSG